MAKNYLTDVAKMLGVELEEEFRIKFADGTTSKTTFKITNKGMVNEVGDYAYYDNFWNLLVGLEEIVKLPWKPKKDEYYYCPFVGGKYVDKFLWVGATVDCALYALGMCYRTREEAEAHFKEDYKKLTGMELGE